MRITIGTFIDTTTVGGYFVAGLKRKVKDALSTSATNVEAVHDLPRVMEAAVDVEIKLDLAVKQVHSVNAAIHYGNQEWQH